MIEFVGHVLMFIGILLVGLIVIDRLAWLAVRLAIIAVALTVFIGRCISTVVKRRQ